MSGLANIGNLFLAGVNVIITAALFLLAVDILLYYTLIAV